jgi:hypothetical protein
VDRNAIAASAPMSGQGVSNGRLTPEQDLYEQIEPLVLFPSGERCSQRFVSSSWTSGNTDQGTVEVSWCLFPGTRALGHNGKGTRTTPFARTSPLASV